MPGLIGRAIGVVALAAVASALAAAAIGAMAATGSEWAGVAAAAAIVLLAAVARAGVARGRSGRRPVPTATGAALLIAAISLSWLVPAVPDVAVSSIEGSRELTTGDGTRLRVVESDGGAAGAAPVIFVHGGPGVADMAHDAPALAAAGLGRD